MNNHSRRKTLLVLGASSDISRATSLFFAGRGWDIILCGRDPAVLERDARDIELRSDGAGVSTRHLDITQIEGFDAFIDSLDQLPDAVLCAVGYMGDQARAEHDLHLASTVMRTNFEGPCLMLGAVAVKFAERKSGTIIGISSVAGDRGRASNYVYGASKAAFTAFLSGLRNRLSRHGVHVITVKPGFVRTRMTEGMDLPGLLTAGPNEVAEAIFRALRRKQDVIYVRSIWRLVMLIVRALPERFFKYTRL